MRPVEYIVVHCSATKPSADIGAAEIRRWHLDRGFSDIGYHFVIRRNGVLERGRPLKKPGAHVKGYNRRSIGICWVGGLNNITGKPEDNRTEEQKITLATLVKALKEIWPYAEVKGHRDFPGVKKACPCFDARAWWNQIKD